MDAFLTWLTSKWDSPHGAWLIPIAAFVAALLALQSLGASPATNVMLSVATAGAAALAWWLSHRPPKIPAGQIGFAVAVAAEGEAERRRVSADFVAAVRENFEQVKDIAQIRVLELPRYHAIRVTDDEAARRLLAQCGGHFLVYGTASVRKLLGKEHYVLRLRGMVLHHPISVETSSQLSQEMGELLPLKVRIACEHDLAGFELTSRSFTEASKFVLATAALVSGDFNLAERLLEQLQISERDLRKLKKMPGIAVLLTKLPVRLGDMYLGQMLRYHQQWRRSRDNATLDLIKDYARKLRKVAPDTEPPHAALSIWHFVRNRDLDAAIRELQVCERKRIRSATWRFSMAFLHAYAGDLDRASRYYEEGFHVVGDDKVPFEVEEFIEWILALEPEKVQLHYCLGLVNLRAKGDQVAAARDLTLFIEQAQARGIFPDHVGRAQAHLVEIGSRGE